MKRTLLRLTLIIIAAGTVNMASAQRYLTEVFSNVTVTSNVQYGENFSVLTGSPILQSLVMDVYEPTGDTEPERPLIVLNHTGSFLPRYINQLPTGDKTDSATVEIANRFARMGYVVAVPAYRLGWNPQGTQDERTETIIQAVYRAMQDAKTCTRWFRKDAAENGNSYGIDVNKVAVGGQGSGGYVSLAYGHINSLQEMQLTKFFNFTTNAFMVDTAMLGDWDGFGGNAALNNENHAGYSSDCNIVFNIGGAIGDSTWINDDEVPVVSIQGVADAFAPFGYGIVNVPGTSLFVVDVSGSSDIIRIVNGFGNNDRFFSPAISDAYTTAADAWNTANDATWGNGGNEGLYPFAGAADGNGPWEFWDDATVNTEAPLLGQDPATILANGYASNPVYQALGPVAGKARAMGFLDTIQFYLAPRLYRVLFEQPDGVSESESHVQVTLYPNPSQGRFYVLTGSQAMIREVEMFDLTGKQHAYVTNLQTPEYVMEMNDIPAGVYFVRVTTDNGIVTQKWIKK